MQTATSRASDCQPAVTVLSGLISRQMHKWPWTSTDSEMYPTNAAALHNVLSLNEFRLREVDNIVVFGLGDSGTVEQQHANYAHQGLTADQPDTQNAAFMQLGIARVIRDYIRTVLRNHAPVNLYVCDQGFTRSIKSILGELEFPVIERSDLPGYINQYSLVYDVTMEAGELQRAVDFSVQENMVAPAAVITHMRNGALDIDLVEKYWLSPLMESTPTLIPSKEMSEVMAAGPGPNISYDLWVGLQEDHSQNVQQGYLQEAAAYNQYMKAYQGYVAHMTEDGESPGYCMRLPKRSWVWDPMMVMLCRKKFPKPTAIVQDPQQHDPLPRQQQPEYQERVENWGVDGGMFEESYELEAADGNGGSSNVGYAPMPGPHGHGVVGSHDGGPGQYLSVPHEDIKYGGWPRQHR